MRAGEHTPQSEVLGNVLKLMLGPRSYEEDVTRLKRVPPAIMNKHSSAADDNVNLVLCVRRLFLLEYRECERDIKGAPLPNTGRALACGDAGLSFGKTDDTATF